MHVLLTVSSPVWSLCLGAVGWQVCLELLGHVGAEDVGRCLMVCFQWDSGCSTRSYAQGACVVALSAPVAVVILILGGPASCRFLGQRWGLRKAGEGEGEGVELRRDYSSLHAVCRSPQVGRRGRGA
jgi:hypothetical protein